MAHNRRYDINSQSILYNDSLYEQSDIPNNNEGPLTLKVGSSEQP